MSKIIWLFIPHAVFGALPVIKRQHDEVVKSEPFEADCKKIKMEVKKEEQTEENTQKETIIISL